MDEAQQLLDRLAEMMENMQVTQGQGNQPGQEAMDGLADTSFWPVTISYFEQNTNGEILPDYVTSFLVHSNDSRRQARARTLDMLHAVQIREPERVYRAYPHEVSGGMGQRIMIAMMMIPEPDIIIADEPTSALDVTVQLQVLSVLDDMIQRRGMGLVFISHDLNLVASFCDRILVMYGGQVMEECLASELTRARHPYTRGLLDCLPRLDGARQRLPVLERDPAWLAQKGETA